MTKTLTKRIASETARGEVDYPGIALDAHRAVLAWREIAKQLVVDVHLAHRRRGYGPDPWTCSNRFCIRARARFESGPKP